MASRFWNRRDNVGVSQYVPLPLDFIAGKIQQEQQGKDVSQEAVTNAVLKSGYINEQTGDYKHWNQTPLYLQKQKEYQKKKEELIDELNKNPFAWKDVYNKTNKLKQDYYTDRDIVTMDESAKEFAKLQERRNKLGVKWREFNDPYINEKYGKGIVYDDKGNPIQAGAFTFNNIDEYVDYLPVSEQIMKGMKASGSKTGWTEDKNGYIYHYTQGHEGISAKDIADYIGIPIVQNDKGQYQLNFNDGSYTEPVQAFLSTDAGKQFIKSQSYLYEKNGIPMTDKDIIREVKQELYREGRKQIFSKTQYDETKKNDTLHAGIALEKWKRDMHANIPIYTPVDNTIKTTDDYNKKKEDLNISKNGLLNVDKSLVNTYNNLGTEMGISDNKGIFGIGTGVSLGNDKVSKTKELVKQANRVINTETGNINLEELAKINPNHPLLQIKDKDKLTAITQSILVANSQQQEYNNVKNKVLQVERNIEAVDNEINKQFDLNSEYNKLSNNDKELFKTKDDFINYIKTGDIKYADLSKQPQKYTKYTTPEQILVGVDAIKYKYNKVKDKVLESKPSLGVEGTTFEPGKGSAQDLHLIQLNKLFRGNKEAIGKLKILNSSENINDKIANGELNDMTSNVKLMPFTDNTSGKTSFIMYYTDLKENSNGELVPTKDSKSVHIEADERTVTAWRDGILQGETENNVKYNNGSTSLKRYNQVKNQLGIGFAETMFKNPEVINEGVLMDLKPGEEISQKADMVDVPNTEFKVKYYGKTDGKDRLYTIKAVNTNTGEVLERQVKASAIKQIIGRIGIRASEHLNSPNLQTNQGITLQNKIKDEFNKSQNNE